VSLIVCTARITYQGSDRIDVTRKGCSLCGFFMAPSWKILAPVLQARKQGSLESEWSRYVEDYIEEMRLSQKRHPLAWADLLRREQVTLVCYCSNPLRCHRWILRTKILPALGAVDGGEMTS
jgi:uncharacterized protein YeaO (DUF488 family)